MLWAARMRALTSYPLQGRCTFLVSERTGWDRRPSVAADGKGLIRHAVVVLHAVADRAGLTAALGPAVAGRRAPDLA